MTTEMRSMMVQRIAERPELCDAAGVPVPEEIRYSPAGLRAYQFLSSSDYGTMTTLGQMEDILTDEADWAAREAARRARPVVAAGRTMSCAACGDAVPCRSTPRGWLCEDCRGDRVSA